ncbi:MAG TPA: ABC transporter ATP-binding protein [Steroidobacteraceae bacterium]|jgi:simple sugar transport system ATP-binding protein|nr:ABC transporter ATP-binding protein [Steroidobacteraceae bacterium]
MAEHNQTVAPRLTLQGISKRYAGVVANEGIDLQVSAGEIHAVLGENGAGKSTLMKIVSGVTRPDAGRIEWDGHPVVFHGPADARRLGIVMVFQHFSLFETLTVVENIALATGERMTMAQLAARITGISTRYGLPIDPHRLVHSMSVGERQRVEIVRCLLQQPKLLILDEPTSVLAPQAVRVLFETLRRLAHEGMSILYISHKLDEIRELCDTATVLRNGVVVGTAVPREQSNAGLARLMVGRELPACRLEARAPGAVQLELINLSRTADDPFGTSLRALCLRVRAGEIVGIAGVSGNGQKELQSAISGETPLQEAGAIRLCGQQAGRLTVSTRRAMGLRFVPEDRLGRGAVPDMSLTDNCILTGARAAGSRGGFVRRGLLQRRAARAFARETIDQYAVKCEGERSLAASLSGGNLQKFIVGREIRLAPRVMLVAQPTWGVDINASLRIRQALIDLRNQGAAVLVISEELDELYMICDRLAVVAAGRLSQALPTVQLPPDTVGVWMTGEFDAATASDGHAG